MIVVMATSLPAAQNSDNPSHSTASTSVRQLRKSLVYHQISAIDTDPNQAVSASDAMRNWIVRLNMLEMPDPTTKSPSQEASKNSHEELLPPSMGAETSQSQASRNEPRQQNADEPILDVIQNHPESIAYPLNTADALFANQDLDKALLYYRLVLKNTPAGESAENRLWALFQTANCLRRRDPAQAIQAYQQMIAEYPGHVLVPTAILLVDILQQQQLQKPMLVLERFGYDPNSL
ncbi:MAG: tetratricopeptide repeat protein [Sedimentisphaerales bacterium]|nr:tetratricopeptide repeat protein [Sedimentisphaerales bacterium]